MKQKDDHLIETWSQVARLLDKGDADGDVGDATMREMLRCFDGELQPKTVISRTKKRLASQHASTPSLGGEGPT